jgi:hypothetical protein
MLDYLLLLVAFVRAAVGGRAALAVENLLLRQQLADLTRPPGSERGCASAPNASEC